MESVPQNRKVSGLTFFVTASVRDQRPVFIERERKDTVLESLDFFRKRGEIELYSFAIMPDHLHLILKVVPPAQLPDIVRRLKTFVAHRLELGTIWNKGYWSEVLGSEKSLLQKMTYVHENPVRAKLVEKAEDYEWSSAKDYFLTAESSRIDPWR